MGYEIASDSSADLTRKRLHILERLNHLVGVCDPGEVVIEPPGAPILPGADPYEQRQREPKTPPH